MTVVDAHHHLWDHNVGEYPWMTGPFAPLRRVYGLDDLTPHLQRNEVAATVVVQVRADTQESSELLALSAGPTPVAGVVGWVDLTCADVGSEIAALRAGPGGDRLVGLRHAASDEPDPRWLLRGDVDAAMKVVEQAGLTFDLEVTARELPAATTLVRRHPGLRFIVDHGAKPPIASGRSGYWARAVEDLAAAPNVWCKLSGLITEDDWGRWSPARLQRYVDHLLRVFGTARLMFGSDWPVCELAAGYDDVLGAARECLSALSDAERDDVFGRTAAHCYTLSISTMKDVDDVPART